MIKEYGQCHLNTAHVQESLYLMFQMSVLILPISNVDHLKYMVRSMLISFISSYNLTLQTHSVCPL